LKRQIASCLGVINGSFTKQRQIKAENKNAYTNNASTKREIFIQRDDEENNMCNVGALFKLDGRYI
jgi:hypothetical protein